jgi:ribonuclease Z
MALRSFLVNGTTGDPVMAIERPGETLLFDCGRSPQADELFERADVLFLSHMHVDHIADLGHWLRLHIGKAPVDIYGPPGLADCVFHAVSMFQCNVPAFYGVKIRVHETGDQLIHTDVHFATPQRREPAGTTPLRDGIVRHTDDYCVRFLPLDHHVVSNAYCYHEHDRCHLLVERLPAACLTPGPCLREVKAAAQRREGVTVEGRTLDAATVQSLFEITPGQKIAYVTDCVYTSAMQAQVAAFACDADELYCEAFFLDEHADEAAAKKHLTLTQARAVAAAARARHVTFMHHSKRYRNLDAFLGGAPA